MTLTEQITELKQRVAAGGNKTALASEYKISQQTLYSYLKGSANLNNV
ncbi:helix-turn-helix domain-containing protein [Shewanella sp. YLB-07]|nr:helix-turn-helix domain-containing protein [Shewanella sp. YLB-07]MPY26905.1 helix-turn-helix domain-containing protein [Shewanella sp. YLB-07]